MQITVLDLINSAAKGKELPENIRLKVLPAITWVRFGNGYYNGKDSLGNIAAFNQTWLNAEIEEVYLQEGAR